MKFKSDIEVQAGLKDSSGAIGTSGQLLSSTSSGVSWTSLNGFVPYVGATANVNLGTHTLLAAKGVFSSSGSGNTVEIGHPSGSGIALNITKGGNGEGLYINKTSGSGNAVTIIGTLNATTLVKAGGTAAQFLKADGTVDSTTYVPASRTITINGVTQSLAANQTWTVSGGVSGSGAVGQVAYWDGTTSITGESNLFWDATNDRLGIGTPSPSAKLDVTDTSAGSLVNNITVQNASNTTSTEAGIFFAPTIATGNIRGARITGIQEDGNNAIGLKFYTGLGATISERMRITSGGNVGIGTTSPTERLTVSNGKLALTTDDVTIGGKIYGYNDTSVNLFSGGLKFETRFFNGSAYVYRDVMTINSSGNVGIGTTSPTRTLDVNGSIALSFNGETQIVNDQRGTDSISIRGASNINFHTFSVSSYVERMRIANNGNVGIGTTSPTQRLHLYSSSAISIYNRIENVNGNTYLGLLANGNTVLSADSAGNNLLLYTESTERMRITSTGNVGIGTTSPSARLNIYNGQRNTDILVLQNDQINGDYVQGFVGISFQDQNGTNASAIRSFSNLFSQWGSTLTFSTNITSGPGLVERMRINSGGNVGIGTTAPDQRLTVDGNIRAGGVGNGFLLDTTGVNFTNGMKVVNSFETAVFSGRGSAGYVIAGDNNLRFGFGVNYSAGESMRITTNGDVCIGTTSANSKFNVTSTFGNTVTFNNTSGFSSASFLGFQASGNGIGGISRNGLANSVLYNTTSDYRLKEDFQDFQGLDLIDNINVYDFKWKGINQREYGVIAHELKEVIPNLVTGEKDGESMQQVDYSKLVPILIQSIKELKAEIEILKNK
jgi:hypothetical protein